MATLLEGVVQDGKVEYEVKQVYIHIPAEKSAAKFELKIAGIIRIITKVGCSRVRGRYANRLVLELASDNYFHIIK